VTLLQLEITNYMDLFWNSCLRPVTGSAVIDVYHRWSKSESSNTWYQ